MTRNELQIKIRVREIHCAVHELLTLARETALLAGANEPCEKETSLRRKGLRDRLRCA